MSAHALNPSAQLVIVAAHEADCAANRGLAACSCAWLREAAAAGAHVEFHLPREARRRAAREAARALRKARGNP